MRKLNLLFALAIAAGPFAGPFLRFSVTYQASDEAAEDALMAETESRLKNIKPIF